MSKDEEPIDPTLARTFKGTLLALGTALAQANPVAGAALVGLAEMTGPGAGGFGAAVQYFRGWKREKTYHNLLQRAEEEKVEPEADAEQVNYFFAQAAPFVENATTERKRQMMEDILFNGLRNLAAEAKRAEAIEAITLIESLTDASLMLFVGALAKLDNGTTVSVQGSGEDTQVIPDCGLKSAIYHHALFSIFNREGRFGANPESKYLIASQYSSANGTTKYFLTEKGRWLADWLANNRLPQATHEITD